MNTGYRYYEKGYAVPEEIKFCKKCVISNQRPRITFDEKGVCSACNFAAQKDTAFDWDGRENELIALLDRHRRSDGSFDVVVPSRRQRLSFCCTYVKTRVRDEPTHRDLGATPLH